MTLCQHHHTMCVCMWNVCVHVWVYLISQGAIEQYIFFKKNKKQYYELIVTVIIFLVLEQKPRESLIHH